MSRIKSNKGLIGVVTVVLFIWLMSVLFIGVALTSIGGAAIVATGW